MSDFPLGRIRRMVEPIPRSGNLFEGRFYNRSIDLITGGYTPWVAGNSLSFIPQEKFQRAKVTKDQVNPGPPYKTGGDFFSGSFVNEYVPSDVLGYGTYENSQHSPFLGKRITNRKYVGGFAPPGDSTFGLDFTDVESLLEIGPSTIPDLSDWGDKAWSRTKPKLEKASAFVFLAELRDFPRMMKHAASVYHGLWHQMRGSTRSWKMLPQKVADDFLSVQFGWAPFLSDINKFHKVVDEYGAFVEKLSEQNGKPIRRRVPLEKDHTLTIISSGTGYPASFSEFSNGQSDWFTSIPSWQLIEEDLISTYAVGRFSYYLPEFDLAMKDYASKWKSIKRFMTLFGLRVSPSNLYKTIPWTWLADWVSNFGDHVDHWNDAWLDSVVCNYLYVMQTRIIKRTYTRVLPFRSGTVNLSWSRYKATKTRSSASSPYGFSLSWDDLSLRQLGILGALGIKRL